MIRMAESDRHRSWISKMSDVLVYHKLSTPACQELPNLRLLKHSFATITVYTEACEIANTCSLNSQYCLAQFARSFLQTEFSEKSRYPHLYPPLWITIVEGLWKAHFPLCQGKFQPQHTVVETKFWCFRTQ